MRIRVVRRRNRWVRFPNKVRLLVARQPTSKHLGTEDQIFASFVKQLNRYENIEATSVGDLKEGQAVERAKAETEAFVILMKFDIDSFQNGTIITNSQDMDIEYFVIAPQTGKKQTKGKVYFQSIGGGRMRRDGWPNGTPIRITPEGTGIEAADGLYFWLKLAAAKKENDAVKNVALNSKGATSVHPAPDRVARVLH